MVPLFVLGYDGVKQFGPPEKDRYLATALQLNLPPTAQFVR
jgi:hypothetical protein